MARLAPPRHLVTAAHLFLTELRLTSPKHMGGLTLYKILTVLQMLLAG
jgi:hypothetical protein